MPNIEIHGLDEDAANRIREDIFLMFRDFPVKSIVDIKDIVVTIFSTQVTDQHGKPQPFLRLVNTSPDGTPIIIGQLRQIGLNVEHVALAGFYPKKK